MQKIFKTAPLDGSEWLVIFAVSLLMLFVPILEKGLERLLKKKDTI
jgi:hypothetical protein